ncbi:MAG: PAS domain S-box protein [Alphaproteobacteria bacterium]|nr:MAG: PAS domain S-box protein [Alphaproteobacteria bacterium]
MIKKISVPMSDNTYRPAIMTEKILWLVYFAGGFSVMLGAMVIYGWFSHNLSLVQIHPTFVAMQFNTALAFILSGVGLIALAAQRTGLARIVTIPLFLIVGITFAQYITGFNFGIDNLFFKAYINIQLSHLGRMAPNTCISFLLMGLAIVAGTTHKAFLKRTYMMRLIGMVILFLSVVALAGYIFHVEAGFGWASLTRMAIHTAIGFLVLGSGIWAFASYESVANRMLFRDAPGGHLPVMAAFVILVASLGTWIYLDTKEIANARGSLSRSLEYVQIDLQNRVESRVRMLGRMVNRWQVERGTPYNKWKPDAISYIKDQKDLIAIQWIDANNNVRWSELADSIADTAEVFTAEERWPTLQSSLVTKQPAFSLPMKILNNSYGLMISVPIFIGERFDGFITGFYEIRELVSSAAIAKQFGSDAWLEISNGNRIIFETIGIDPTDKLRWSIQENLDLYGSVWSFEAWPTQKFLLAQRSAFPEMILTAGILLAFLVAHILRQAEITRHQTNLLGLSEETFRNAMEYAPVGMGLIFPSGEWYKVNKALRNMMGYSEVEIFTLNLQTITHPDDWPEDQKRLNALLRGDIQSFQIEKRFIHKSGKLVWALINASLARNPNGTPKYIIKQILDITERKEIERVKSEFVSMVSHELRTPLTSIRGSLGLILGAMNKSLPDKVLNHISIAHRNCERLIVLINDILDLDKITSGNMQFDIRPEKLSSLIQQAVEGNQSYAEKYKVHFEVRPIPLDMIVYADSNRTIQVLANLLSNAAKFSPEQATVIVAAEQKGKFIRISVKDSGSGIPQDFRSRIFNKFCQADSSATRQKGGSGLGLNISRELVERMHGNMGFESEEGKGSLFWFELPSTDEFGMRAAEPMAKQEQVYNDNRPLILHIEDDVDLSTLLANALSERAEIIQAPTIYQAEKLLKEKNFSLVILDINMPDGNGLTLLDRMATLTDYPVPWLILSAYETTLDIRDRVAATMIKSRVPEGKVIETILKILQQPTTPKEGEKYGT